MTSTALDLNHAAAALAIQPGQIAWDAAQAAALDQLGLADAPAGDLSVFLHVSQRTRLDPFARQIYMIGRKEKKSEKRNGQWVDVWTVKYTIQTGIEGFRVIRGRAEHDEGIRGILGRPVYYDHEGKEYKIWFQQRPPVAVEMTYTVRDRNGNETPYTSVLRYSEYVQTRDDNGTRVPVAQWAVKPVHMLEKCTEADVYRKAFPQDFSGIYLDDAMPQDAPQDDAPQDGAPANGGRPRGRVTAGEVIGRRPAETASDEGAKQEAPRTAAEPDPMSRQAANSPTRAASESVQPATQTSTAPEDERGSASEDQLTSLHIILGGLGFGGQDRDAKLKLAETITGRELTGPHPGRSSKNLSFTEARKLTDTLAGFGGDREKLIGHMAGREQDGDGDA